VDGRGFAVAAAMEVNMPPSDNGERRPGEQWQGDLPATILRGGEMLAAISNGIVAIMREHYGRGPMKAKTYVLDDIIVVVLRGAGFTALEKTIMDSGESTKVVAMREDFQRYMADAYKALIQQLTGRNVVAFLSQAHVEPDITIEIFFVDGELPGFGALEIEP
jgi:uncharacterized protein YbcI